jgi:glycosyltransferase involved in cell wall biosynthesis
VAVPDGVSFLEAFRLKHSRAPRILHVGNIANNAYLNAKFLNRAGYDCDVICYDYYHVMACPEWEDADLTEAPADQLKPDWTAIELGTFERPRWFAQGPQARCIEYLMARRQGQKNRSEMLWMQLGEANGTRRPDGPTRGDVDGRPRGGLANRARRAQLNAMLGIELFWDTLRGVASPQRLWRKLERTGEKHGVFGWLLAGLAAPLLMLPVVLVRLATGERRAERRVDISQPSSLAGLLERFDQAFPGRTDRLRVGDYVPYSSVLERWSNLFAEYDIVQAYSTDVAYPLLTGFRPYLGFEHGTLRDFTMGDSATCRLTALGYREADHVLITNGDCLDYARRLAVPCYSAMIHPIDEERIAGVKASYDATHQRFGAKYLFFCPLRHDWKVKGTDHYIRALPGIAARIGRDFKLIMTCWGAQLEESRALAANLGVADLIAWIEPVTRVPLIELQKSVDIVFDQIALPHFGATAPQAIAAGVPVIMSYDPSSTEWIIPEPAPILSAWNAGEVVEAVVTALDPAWREQYRVDAKRWFDTHHSSREAVRRLSNAYYQAAQAQNLL